MQARVARNAVPAAKARAAGLRPAAAMRGMSAGAARMRRRIRTTARRLPAAVAMVAARRPSTVNGARIWKVEAPRAVRVATSLRRTKERERKRLLALTQAEKSSKTEAMRASRSWGREEPVRYSGSGVTTACWVREHWLRWSATWT